MTTVQILLTLHILSALVAVGATVSYFFWMRRAVLVPESRKFTLETLRILELRMVSPAYVILFLTGLGLIDRAKWGWSTPWLELSILLFIVLMGLVGFHTRLIRQQIELTENGPDNSTEYDSAHARGRWLLLAKVVVIVALVYLMVFKPPLWG
ncbi:MAG: DUF2269 family protein [Dehalococcoidia bacterium]|nr:DUF2269 family protein [Dehalococcoidia bacterium]